MNACLETIAGYGLRAIGHGERLLPKTEITVCEQAVLIGSGMLWNIYFAFLAVLSGFFLATLIAVGKASDNAWARRPADAFVFFFRGSPLFIQFFFAYELFVQIPNLGFDLQLGFMTISASTSWLKKAWLGALVVLFLNTSAYSASIFYGALKAVPKGDLEAAASFGMSGFTRFRRIVWPTLLRLAWPAYTNEAIFLFHATTLVFFSSFPAWRQSGDALYYASYFAEKTFNPFIAYPIAGGYFIAFTLLIIWFYGVINRRLNRHLAPSERPKLKYRPQLLR